MWVSQSLSNNQFPHPLPSNLPIRLEQTVRTRIAAWCVVIKIASDATRVWIFNKKKPRGPTTVRGCNFAAAMGVSEARMNVESINYALRRFLFCGSSLIKWSGCAWPACRLIALCNSLQLPVLAVMHDFRDVFTPIVQQPVQVHAHATVSMSRPTVFLSNCCEKSKRNLTCTTQNLELLLRPFQTFLRVT